MTYWHLLDMFGRIISWVILRVLFSIQTMRPRAELYKFVDDELTAITPLLKQFVNEWSLPCRSSSCLDVKLIYIWMLKCTLNWTVYKSTSFDYKKITGSTYRLHTNYNQLFLADNDKMVRKTNLFFAVFDGLRTQTYGGTTFLTHAPVGGSMNAAHEKRTRHRQLSLR
jgi:hypothetical protein